MKRKNNNQEIKQRNFWLNLAERGRITPERKIKSLFEEYQKWYVEIKTKGSTGKYFPLMTEDLFGLEIGRVCRLKINKNK